APSGHDGKGADRATLWCDLRWKCGEISALALQADDPESAAAYVLDYLPKLFEYAFGFGAGKESPQGTYAAPCGHPADQGHHPAGPSRFGSCFRASSGSVVLKPTDVIGCSLTSSRNTSGRE